MCLMWMRRKSRVCILKFFIFKSFICTNHSKIFKANTSDLIFVKNFQSCIIVAPYGECLYITDISFVYIMGLISISQNRCFELSFNEIIKDKPANIKIDI